MRHALLTYTRTRNVGDPVQSIAAWQHLPTVDDFADREFLSEFNPQEQTKLILNGWFCHRPWGFWINRNVEPLPISFHINPNARGSYSGKAFTDTISQSPQLQDLFKRIGPIGARDVATAEFLESLGIETYLSGCLTLTLQRDETAARGETVILADVATPVEDHVHKITRRPITKVGHVLEKFATPHSSFAHAERLLDLYQSAHLVLTSRLHVALPCLALGTPVLLLRRDFSDPRFEGLSTLTNRFTYDEFLRLPGSLLDQPPDNPNDYRTYRKALNERVAAFLGSEGLARRKAQSASKDLERLWKQKGLAAPLSFISRWVRRKQ